MQTLRANMNVYLFALMLSLSIPAGIARAVDSAEMAVLRLGSWNIQWLGRADRRAVLQKPEDIARYLIASQVDLLCLNEITGDGQRNNLPNNGTLIKALQIVKDRTGQTWEHLLFPKEDRNDKDQLCGVAWNTAKVKLVGQPWRVPLRRSAANQQIWNRHPHAVKFSTGQNKTDLVLIPVHMKSNYGGEAAASKQRAEEAKMLVRGLGELQNHFKDDDVVILGDFNVLKKTEKTLERYGASGFKDLNEKDQPTWIESDRYPAAPFDRVFVPDDQPEFKSSAMQVFKGHHLGSEKEFRKWLSDHYMVVTEVKIMADDD